MLKSKKINIADTNLANFGTELEKSVKRAAALSENQWNNAGTEPGIQIWRIEKFKVVPWPKKQYGQFHIGDSYIVLHTQKKKNSDALVWDVYFWLGDETTQDEAGTAAYKTVELDDVLRGAPVQHREVQGFESAAFLALFAKFEYLEGGVETGFRHVEPEQYRSRLLHVKGKEKLAVFEVDRSVKSMNCGDVFILDCGLKLIQFNGKECSTQEKMKAGELVRAMRDERGSKAEIVTVEQESNGPDHQEFFKLVGGSPADIQPASVAGDDLEVQSEKVLFRLTDGEPNAPAVTEPESDTVQLGTFDATKDAEAMRGALKKLIGKDSALIIEMFARRTQAQLKQIASKYAQTYKRDMCKDIKGKSKTAFDFKHLIDDMLSDPLDLEVDRLLSALGMNETSEPKTTVDKAGPLARIDRGLVSEIILIRDAQALQALTTKFKASTGVELKTAIEKRVGTLFGSDLKKLLLKYLETPRSDGNADDAAAKVTAAKLIKAGEGKFFGTNSDTFIEIFATQSYDQLRKVFEEYDQQSKYGSIDDSLKHELSGQFREAMRLIVSIARGETPNHFARRLHKSMKGLGTDDSTLRYIIISYRKIINEIKAAYYVQFGRTLSHDIEGDTSGNYKKLLLKLVGEDDPAKYGHKPLKFEKVASGVIKRDQLDSGDVFVLYNGFEVFAWVGKGSSKVERRSALQYAQMFLSQAKLPQHTPITRILEGGENTLFEKSFD